MTSFTLTLAAKGNATSSQRDINALEKEIFLQNLCALSQIEIHIHFTSCKL